MKNKTKAILKSPIVVDAIAEAVLKAFSNKQKEKHQKTFIAFTEKWEKKFVDIIRKNLRKQEYQVLSKLSNMKNMFDENITIKASGWTFPDKEWTRLLKEQGSDFFTILYEVYGKEIFRELEYDIGLDITGMFDVTPEYLQDRIEKASFKFADNMVGRITEKLRGALSEGMLDGEPMIDIADRIKGIYKGFSDFDALRVARTETIKMSNAAAEEAYFQSGVIKYKEWLTAADDRVCGHCSKMNGKVIKVGKNFFDLGDNLSAVNEDGEKVNMVFDYEDIKGPPLHPMCRCCLLPVIDEKLLEL